MKIRTIFFLIPVLIISGSCAPKSLNADRERMQAEIFQTEKAFAEMAADSGIGAAFIAFAAPEAVLKRGNRLIVGRDSIRRFFDRNEQLEAKLTWSPDFTDVAASGDMAYTWGRFVWSCPDSSGTIQKTEGIFHTVWKRQADGSWKFVWD